jgi:hypothetical protein
MKKVKGPALRFAIGRATRGRLEVCDDAHWAFVMKKVKGPALRFAIGRATRRIASLPGGQSVVQSPRIELGMDRERKGQRISIVIGIGRKTF